MDLKPASGPGGLAYKESKIWAELSIWILIFLWKTFWLGLLIVLIAFGSKTTTKLACKPDDSFSPFTDYNWWSPDSFFQITLRTGDYSFSQVKIIDVVWNLVSTFSTIHTRDI